MSDAFEPKTPATGQETRQLVCLGDGQGDNAKLAAALEKISEKLNHEAPSEWRVTELLRQLLEVGWVPCQFVYSVLKEAINRFTGHEVKLIRAKAEADKLTAEAEAIRTKSAADATATVAVAQATAKKTEAEATAILAEAAMKQKEVEQLQAQIGNRDALLKKLLARGMDWQAVVDDDGKMRIVVIKKL